MRSSTGDDGGRRFRNMQRIHSTAADAILQPVKDGSEAQKADARTVIARRLTDEEKTTMEKFRESVQIGGALCTPNLENVKAILQFYKTNPRLTRAQTVQELLGWCDEVLSVATNQSRDQ
jgi:hypothetical protein